MTPTPWTRLAARIERYAEKAEREPDEWGFRAAARVYQLQELAGAIQKEIDREIIHAREQGASWGTLGMRSKQAGMARYRAAIARRR
jgi:hypothetical protein